MNEQRSLFIPSTIALLASLTACGGAGGQLASAPVTPVPSPAADPSTPAPVTNGPAGFYPLPVDAPMVSYGAGVNQVGDGPKPINSIISYGPGELTIDFNPSTRDYTVSVPGRVSGRTVENTTDATPSSTFRFFDIINAQAAQPRQGWLTVARKGETNLTYTALANFTWGGDQLNIVTGLPTSPAEVPVTGNATYLTEVRGWSTEGTDISGNFHLNFDFAKAGLSGRMTLSANDGTGAYRKIGDYQVANGMHQVGGTAFSGGFMNPGGLSGLSLFEGSFMGPGAAEVGGRWQVPIRIPQGSGFPTSIQGDYHAAGVFAGSRR